ncbi:MULTISPECIES: ABC transporter ATP-binding protein [Corynebacterium]|uniref:ABC transporter ATP-binding protein n=1 Tax=Corynebacterium TaxID=1716 RepID=UPI000AF79164|nr:MULTISPECIES: ABC transporter ATP-binding protein [Corynebacterium]MDK8877591.1 ABC transporter ATP-binding protein [Corynebacterium striatum]
MVQAVRAQHVRKHYIRGSEKVCAVNDINLLIPKGEFVAIMGPSGSGKSTLLKCLAGLEEPTSGHVFIGNDEITGKTDREVSRLRREKIGYIFQDYNLLPTLTARDNILLPLRLANRKPDFTYFEELIEVLGLKQRLNHMPSELSGGQMQRVAAARALLSRPTVIFADEPTGSLDEATSESLLKLLSRGVSEQQQTIVMVTHDPEAAKWASQVINIRDGKVVA